MNHFPLPRSSVIAAICTLFATAAVADIRGDWLAQAPAAYREECGGCHVPFPPQLLSAPDWRQVMAQLDRHYGDNAELPSETARMITDYLTRWAGSERKLGLAPGTPPRLTQTRYFLKEHRKVPDAIWRRADVRSPANCGACHQSADRGVFDEANLMIPGVGKWRKHD